VVYAILNPQAESLLTCEGLYMFFICVMWGYEGLAGTAVIGLGAFRAQYGTPYEGDYVVDANWQLGFTASTLAGTLPWNDACFHPLST